MSARIADLRESATVVCAFVALVLAILAGVLGAPTWALVGTLLAVVGCALLGFRPWWAALAAVLSAALSGIALWIDEFGPRPWLGAVALACGLVYAARSHHVWRRAPADPPAGAAPRWSDFAALVCSSGLALGGTLVGLAFVVGALMARRTQPIPLAWMYVALLGLLGVVVFLCWWWARSFARSVLGANGRHRWGVLVGVALVGLALWQLDDRSITNSRPVAEVAQQREAALGRFDLLLVVDPADPASRRLIQAAERDLQQTDDDPFGDRIARLLAPRVPDSTYDVAFGLAVAEPGGGGGPLWRLLEPPTQDDRELAESLAKIPLRDAEPAPGSYGRLLHDATIQQRVRWREGAQRAVAFMLEHLPAGAELDGAGAGARTPDEDDPARVCDALDGGGTELPSSPSEPVAWGEALRRLCFERRSFKAWELAGRPRESRVLPPLGVFALTRESDPERLDDWSTWTLAMGGRVHVLPPTDRLGSDPAVELLQDARDVFTSQPAGNLATVVRTYRPHLFLDESEKFGPVDVDWLLYPDARRPHEGTRAAIECTMDGDVETGCEQVSPQPSDDSQSVCDRDDFTVNCEPVQARASLAGPFDELIDFAGGARLGADVVRGDLDPPRMYVHVREGSGRIFLGYWWYFRYNVSPWRTEVNCLPGLGFGGISCHDHEGDWEGVTVVLEPRGRPRDRYLLGNLEPDAVVFDAHGRSIRWEWPQVDLAADPGQFATHPVVYVATGSHASYPTGCTRAECDQRLSGEPIGEGGFDGAKPWRYNSAERCDAFELSRDTRGPCLIALPSTDAGARGVLWNAFPGAWGRARCTVIGKVCSQVDGPKSPSFQKRFRVPSESRPGRVPVLRAMRRRFGQPHASSAPRWPPDPWPVPAPATAAVP